MSAPLKALQESLEWQVQELTLQCQEVEKQSSALRSSMTELEKKLKEQPALSGTINPELEIIRLHFITREQQKKQALSEQLFEEEHKEKQLKARLLRLNTELKLLEKYLTKKHKQTQQELQQEQQHQNDEWYLQHRKTAG